MSVQIGSMFDEERDAPVWRHSGFAGIEAATAAVTRLDALVSASPLREAWLIHAALLGALSCSAIDGISSRREDVFRRMLAAPGLSTDAIWGARAASGYWMRRLAELPLSGFSRRLLGLDAPSRRDAMAEAEEQWHLHEEGGGRSAADIARDVQAERLAAVVERRRRDASYAAGSTSGETKIERFLAGVHRACKDLGTTGSIEDHDGDLGRVFFNAPRWLLESGICTTPLPCLTGASRALARARSPAGRGLDASMNAMIDEARAGIDLLNRLTLMAQRWARTLRDIDPRSTLPKVAAAFLIMPVLDADWLGRALGIADRSAERLIKRLGAAAWSRSAPAQARAC